SPAGPVPTGPWTAHCVARSWRQPPLAEDLLPGGRTPGGPAAGGGWGAAGPPDAGGGQHCAVPLSGGGGSAYTVVAPSACVNTAGRDCERSSSAREDPTAPEPP